VASKRENFKGKLSGEEEAFHAFSGSIFRSLNPKDHQMFMTRNQI
jgi:hypothetical protein